MQTCAVRGYQDNVVGTDKLFLGEVVCTTERLKDISEGATVSGVREFHFITHTESIPTDVKPCPLQ